MRLQAVLFDLWGTLILDPPERSRPRQVWRCEQVQRVLESHSFQADFDMLDLTLREAMSALGGLQDKGIDLKHRGRAGLFAEVFERKTGRALPPASLDEIEDTITTMPEAFQPLPAADANETLRQIKGMGLGTALVSNAGFTTAPHLRRMLRDFELMPGLDVLVFSDELGVAKPDARIFQEALAGIGLAAGDCAFVGDSPHNDIGGAKSAGLFAVQVGNRRVDGIEPDARIELLEELLPALAVCF